MTFDEHIQSSLEGLLIGKTILGDNGKPFVAARVKVWIDPDYATIRVQALNKHRVAKLHFCGDDQMPTVIESVNL